MENKIKKVVIESPITSSPLPCSMTLGTSVKDKSFLILCVKEPGQEPSGIVLDTGDALQIRNYLNEFLKTNCNR